MTTFERVQKLLVEHLGANPERVTPTASIIDDLGADSLDMIELIMAAEEEFSIEIPDHEAEKLLTAGDAVDYIDNDLSSRDELALSK